MSITDFDVFFFGDRWDAPAFDDAIQMPVPIGDPCGYCGIEIVEGDSGTFQHFFEMEQKAALMRPLHIECWFRAGMGSPAHMRGECSCKGSVEPEDDRNWYEQGTESIRIFKAGEAWFQVEDKDPWPPSLGAPAPEADLP